MDAIARLIRKAQVASDAAKGIFDICILPRENRYRESYSRDCYREKDSYIIAAISAICATHSGKYRFSVQRGSDQNGNSSFLVYFDFKINGKREQVSFHSFNGKLWKYVDHSRASTWSRDTSSRETAEKLRKQ